MSGERSNPRAPPPLDYQHLHDGLLFPEPTAPPPPLRELPYPYGLGDGACAADGVLVEKEWEGLLVPTRLQLLRNSKGDRLVVKVYDGVLQDNMARIKSIYCSHPGWSIVNVRACNVADSSVPSRPAGGAKPVQVLIVQDYMDLHSFKDILPPPPLPQQPPTVPEAACAWAAKCVRCPSRCPLVAFASTFEYQTPMCSQVLRALRYIGSCRHATPRFTTAFAYQITRGLQARRALQHPPLLHPAGQVPAPLNLKNTAVNPYQPRIQMVQTAPHPDSRVSGRATCV
jgi:hypothetical protein